MNIKKSLRRPVAGRIAKQPAGNDTPYRAIDAYVERERRRLKMPGVSLAIVDDNQIVHARGFGRSRPHGETPTPQTPFLIGSLTKSITALAVMQLVEAGKIDLDAPAQRYLPWFRVADPRASAQITVRHLLNQTSGLPMSAGEIPLADFDAGPCAAECQMRALSTLELTRPPGAAFEYSNANYNLLGLIIEAAAGERYAEVVQKQIFAPLAMRRTFTSPAVARQNGMAVGHRYWFAHPIPAPGLPLPLGSLASGQLISTAEDMARYLIAYLNGGRCGGARVLSPAGIDEVHRGVDEFHAYGLSLGQYAMGWFVDEIGGTRLIWHGGTNPDFGAYMALLPEQKKGIVLLFNACHWWFNPVLSDFGTGATALLAGEQPAPTLFFNVVPWMLRSQLLIPAFQIVDVAAALWRLRQGRRPAGRPNLTRSLLLPLFNLLLGVLTLRPLLSKRRGYLRLFMPDFYWMARVCGPFALLRSLVRTGVTLLPETAVKAWSVKHTPCFRRKTLPSKEAPS